MSHPRNTKERLLAKLKKSPAPKAPGTSKMQRIVELQKDIDLQYAEASICRTTFNWQGRVDAYEICFNHLTEILQIEDIYSKKQKAEFEIQQGQTAYEISKSYGELADNEKRITWLKKATLLGSAEAKIDWEEFVEVKTSSEELKKIAQQRGTIVSAEEIANTHAKIDKMIDNFQHISSQLLTRRDITTKTDPSHRKAIADMFQVYYVNKAQDDPTFESQIDKIAQSALFIQNDFPLLYSLAEKVYQEEHLEELKQLLHLILKMSPKTPEDKEIKYKTHAILAFLNRKDETTNHLHLQEASNANIPLANFLLALTVDGEEKKSYFEKAANKGCVWSKMFLSDLQREESSVTQPADEDKKSFHLADALEAFRINDTPFRLFNGYYPKPSPASPLNLMVRLSERFIAEEKKDHIKRFIEYRFWLSMALRFSGEPVYLNYLLSAFFTLPEKNFNVAQLKEVVDRYSNVAVPLGGGTYIKPAPSLKEQKVNKEGLLNTLHTLQNSLKKIAPEQHNRTIIKSSNIASSTSSDAVIHPDEIITLGDKFLFTKQKHEDWQKSAATSLNADMIIENKTSNFICLAGIIFHYHLKADRRYIEKYHEQIISVINDAVEMLNKFNTNTLCLMLLGITRLDFLPTIPQIEKALNQFLQVIICILPNCSMQELSYVLLSVGLTKIPSPMQDFYLLALCDEIKYRLSHNAICAEKELGLILYSLMLLEESNRPSVAHSHLIATVNIVYQSIDQQWKNHWQKNPGDLSPYFNRQLFMAFHYFKTCCPDIVNTPNKDFFLFLNDTFIWSEDADYTDDTHEKISDFVPTENFYAVLNTSEAHFTPNNETYIVSQLEKSIFAAIKDYFGKSAEVISSVIVKGLSVDISIVQGERVLHLQVNGPSHYLHGLNGELVLNNKSRVNQLLLGNCDIISYQEWNNAHDKQQFIKQLMDKHGFIQATPQASIPTSTLHSASSFVANIGHKTSGKKHKKKKKAEEIKSETSAVTNRK